MKFPTITLRQALLWAVPALSTTPALAQTEVFAPSNHTDGTLWAQSLAPKLTAGSAQLVFIDLGPPGGPGVSGLQSAWLEWNTDHVWTGLLGGGTSSAEVTLPGGAAMSSCLGAATLRGGFVLTYTSGIITGVEVAAGSFLWTPTKLYLFALGGGVLSAEVTAPGGVSISGVMGISIVDSFILETSTVPTLSDPVMHASALVYTATNVYHVAATLGGGIASTTTEVLAPGGGSIGSVRGIAALVGEADPGTSPPVDSLGAALIWNDGHVYLLTKTPAIGMSEVTAPGGGAIAGCWGAMRLGASGILPIRASALVWQADHGWIVAIEPGVTVVEATQPPGVSTSSPIVTNVSVPAGGVTPLVERQAAFLYEILGTMLIGGTPKRTLIVGQNQREY